MAAGSSALTPLLRVCLWEPKVSNHMGPSGPIRSHNRPPVLPPKRGAKAKDKGRPGSPQGSPQGSLGIPRNFREFPEFSGIFNFL